MSNHEQNPVEPRTLRPTTEMEKGKLGLVSGGVMLVGEPWIWHTKSCSVQGKWGELDTGNMGPRVITNKVTWGENKSKNTYERPSNAETS